MIKEYRRKPTRIAAIQYNGDNKTEILIFTGIDIIGMTKKRIESYPQVIQSSRGTFSYELGDYIIKGEDGDFYVCKAELFKQLHTPYNDNDIYRRAETMISDLEYNIEKRQGKNVSDFDIKISKFCAEVASVIKELLKRV